MNDMGWEKKLNYGELPVRAATNLDPQLVNSPPASSGSSCWPPWVRCRHRLSAVERRRRCLWLVMAVVAAVGLPLHARRVGSGTPASCPSTTWRSTCSPPSVSAELGRTRGDARRRTSDEAGRAPWSARSPSPGRRWPRAGSPLAMPLCSLPGHSIQLGELDVAEWLQVVARCRHEGQAASSTSGRRWNFTGYEGKPAYPEYHDIIQTMGRARQDQRLRPGHVGARGAARPLRHPDGADAAAVLDRRLHRLDGGPLLRGVGHHAVPLPQPGRALDRRRRTPSATCPTCRGAQADRVRPRHRAPADAGREVLHGHLRRR